MEAPAVRDAVRKVVEGSSLSRQEARAAMMEIMEGLATPAQIGAYITALRIKGETVSEIAGSAEAMREHATRIPIEPEGLVDTCGTGGDGAHTVNISTMAAIVAAGAGVRIAKHGNRSVSSRCGSADVLKALGVNLDISPEGVAACIREANIGFLFAPLCHGAMKYAIGPRREIGIRTVFNILGPLCNPARAARQVIGVFSPSLTEVLAGVLAELGSEHVWTVHGSDGLDEITLTGDTTVTEVRGGQIRTFRISPASYGLHPCASDALRGGEPEENARIVRETFAGRKGPYREIAALNAGAAILVGNRASSLEEGIATALASIDEGRASDALDRLVEVSNEQVL